MQNLTANGILFCLHSSVEELFTFIPNQVERTVEAQESANNQLAAITSLLKHVETEVGKSNKIFVKYTHPTIWGSMTNLSTGLDKLEGELTLVKSVDPKVIGDTRG